MNIETPVTVKHICPTVGINVPGGWWYVIDANDKIIHKHLDETDSHFLATALNHAQLFDELVEVVRRCETELYQLIATTRKIKPNGSADKAWRQANTLIAKIEVLEGK